MSRELIAAGIGFLAGSLAVVVGAAIALAYSVLQSRSFRELLKLSKAKHPEQLKAYDRADQEKKGARRRRRKPKEPPPSAPLDLDEFVEIQDWQSGDKLVITRREAQRKGFPESSCIATGARTVEEAEYDETG